jgi:hypothetical protein
MILFTVIEGDNNNINNNSGNVKVPRMYEQEAIKCFQQWRQNAGSLKDVDIICYAPTKNLPSADTILKLKELNVTYVENYLPVSEQLEYGFFLIPFVGKILEEWYFNDTLIHIDLDMNIIKPIPERYFDGNVYVGQYDDVSSLSQRNLDKWENPLDTGFTISPPSSKFYTIFCDEFSKLYFDKSYEHEQDWLDQDASLFFLEEYVADKMLNNKRLEMKTIKHYQLGEGYSPVSEFSDEQLKEVIFWHEHLFVEETDEWAKTKIRQKIEFNKRTRG